LGQFIGQIIVDVLSHAFSEQSRELIERVRELAILLRVHRVVIFADDELSVLDLEAELFLVDVRHRLQSKSHVGQVELPSRCLFCH